MQLNIVDKWICTECRFIGADSAFDKVKDPDGDDTWRVCPRCRTPEHIGMVCDEPGCNEETSCGFPTGAGYRHTCYKHSTFNRERPASG
jgi:hypothetical protein